MSDPVKWEYGLLNRGPVNTHPKTEQPCILIVDDDPLELRSLGTGLRLEGFQVLEASSAESALDALSTKKSCLAIVDLMMPGMNGINLTREIRKLHPETEVILTSAYHISEKLLDRARVDILSFLPKPFRIDDLIQFIHEKLGILAQGKAYSV